MKVRVCNRTTALSVRDGRKLQVKPTKSRELNFTHSRLRPLGNKDALLDQPDSHIQEALGQLNQEQNIAQRITHECQVNVFGAQDVHVSCVRRIKPPGLLGTMLPLKVFYKDDLQAQYENLNQKHVYTSFAPSET